MTKQRRTDLKLSDSWLYAVNSPSDLARRLATPKHKVSAAELSALAKDAGNFRLFSITGASGKSREIQGPKRRLQWLHARIHTLLSRVEVPEYLHSAVRGRSYISNAAAHDHRCRRSRLTWKNSFRR